MSKNSAIGNARNVHLRVFRLAAHWEKSPKDANNTTGNITTVCIHRLRTCARARERGKRRPFHEQQRGHLVFQLHIGPLLNPGVFRGVMCGANRARVLRVGETASPALEFDEAIAASHAARQACAFHDTWLRVIAGDDGQSCRKCPTLVVARAVKDSSEVFESGGPCTL
jgi:hypothetical protein